MKPKPSHLQPEYGAQFGDKSVAETYGTRLPYPPELFDFLVRLSGNPAQPILDLGCGTGDIALGIAALTTGLVDAVDQSEAMLAVARRRRLEGPASVRWFCESAEEFRLGGPYALVVAGESLHWMDWNLVLPKIEGALSRGAHLAIVEGREFKNPPWRAELLGLIPRYSTNQAYQPYDLIQELTSRGLFREVGRRTIHGGSSSQPIDDYIESFHTRNGFSRERMPLDQAHRFDDAARSLVGPFAKNGVVSGVTTTSVVWGLPGSA